MFAPFNKLAKRILPNRTVEPDGTEKAVISNGVSTVTVRTNVGGALWLENSGQTPGNARGYGAFDWQVFRTTADQVASGSTAVAFGRNNKVTGNFGAAAIGNGHTVTADSGIALGSEHTVSAANGFAAGGNCTASVSNSAAAIGYYSTSSGFSAIALGSFANNAIACSLALGGGTYNGNQTGIIPLSKQTADATPTVLDLLNNAAYRATLPASRAWHFRGQCIARSSAHKASAWSIEGVIIRDASNDTRIVGTPTIALIAQDAEMAGTAVAVSADNTNEALTITVTGLAATTIGWTCSIFYSQA